jgi:probable rRNA maturation factor
MAKMLLKDLGYPESSVSILITDNKEIAELNEKFRNKSGPTDVLSFAMQEGLIDEHVEAELGDLVISLDKAESQAIELNVTIQEELARLLVHGMLHLMGYDHENVSKAEALKMKRKEEEMLEILSAIYNP